MRALLRIRPTLVVVAVVYAMLSAFGCARDPTPTAREDAQVRSTGEMPRMMHEMSEIMHDMYERMYDSAAGPGMTRQMAETMKRMSETTARMARAMAHGKVDRGVENEILLMRKQVDAMGGEAPVPRK